MKRILIWASLLMSTLSVHGQTNSGNIIGQQLLHKLFQEPGNGFKPHRSFIRRTNHRGILTSISGSLIFFYQNVLSDQIQADCTYQITCSEYLKHCIDHFGFVKGTMSGLNQYMKCSSNNHKNHCEYRRDEANKIINRIDDEAY